MTRRISLGLRAGLAFIYSFFLKPHSYETRQTKSNQTAIKFTQNISRGYIVFKETLMCGEKYGNRQSYK